MPTTRSGRKSCSATKAKVQLASTGATTARDDTMIQQGKRTRDLKRKKNDRNEASTTCTKSRLSRTNVDESPRKKARTSVPTQSSILRRTSSSESAVHDRDAIGNAVAQPLNRSSVLTVQAKVEMANVTPATTTANQPFSMTATMMTESDLDGKDLLPEGVVPIFEMEDYTSMLARPSVSLAQPVTHHSMISSSHNSDDTPQHPSLLFATPTPTHSRSRWTASRTNEQLKRPSRRFSLVHSHLTMYGADYWRELVVRERKEATAVAMVSAADDDDDESSAMSDTWDDDTTASAITEKENTPHCGDKSSTASTLEGSQLNVVLYTSDDEDDIDVREQIDVEEQASARLPHQPLLTFKMRRVLVLWMSEVAQEYKLSEAAYHLAVTLLDTVVTREPLSPSAQMKSVRSGGRDDESSVGSSKWFMPRDFQALGCACLWIASKMEDKTPPLAEQLVYISNYCFTADKLAEFETRICRELNFRLHRVTPFHFVALYLRASRAQPVELSLASTRQLLSSDDDGKSSVVMSMTLYLLELARSSYILSNRPPSLLAAAVVYLARATLGIRTSDDLNHRHSVGVRPWTGVYWSRTLAYYSGYETHEMVDSIRHLHALHRAAERRPNDSPPPSFLKYQSASRHRVSLRTVRRVEDLGLVRIPMADIK